MSALDLFKPGNTALVIVDKQNAYMDTSLLAKRGKHVTKDFKTKFSALERFIQQARTHDIPIIWTQMTEDAYLSPAPIAAKMQIAIESGETVISAKPGSLDYEIAGQLLPSPGEIIIAKTHYDAFSNPELVTALRKLGVSSVILVGGFTSRCVLGTAYGANNHNLHVCIPTDLVTMPQEYMHEETSAFSIVNAILGYTCSSHELLRNWG